MRPLQVGYRVKREDKLTKPELGHLKKHNAPPMRKLREFKVCGHWLSHLELPVAIRCSMSQS